MSVENSNTSIHLEQWFKGDRKSLDTLVQQNLPWIHARVSQRLGGLLRAKGDTCDYVQDAMVQFLQYAPHFVISDENQFRALLAKIVENALRKKHHWYTARRREIARERPLPSDTLLCLDPIREKVRTPSQSVGQHEDEAWIRLGMEFLDPDDRDVLVLRNWDNLSFVKIGEKLEMTADGARKRNKRAMLRLSKIVASLRKGEFDTILDKEDRKNQP